MYDLHNHLLPGIDDGAPDIDTAIELAKIAVDDGITHMVCTPHIHPGRYENTFETIQTALKQLQAALLKNQIKLNIAAAAEVRIGPEILQMVPHNSLPFLGKWQNNDVLLLEFPSNAVPVGSDKLTQWLIKRNITPIIAHPERNQIFQSQPERLKAFINQGCLLQVTGSALLGNFGQTAKETALELLKSNKITLLASDAHNINYRPPLLSDCYEFVKNEVSDLQARMLLINNPKQISDIKFAC